MRVCVCPALHHTAHYYEGRDKTPLAFALYRFISSPPKPRKTLRALRHHIAQKGENAFLLYIFVSQDLRGAFASRNNINLQVIRMLLLQLS